MNIYLIIGFVLYFLICYLYVTFLRKANYKTNRYDYYENKE